MGRGSGGTDAFPQGGPDEVPEYTATVSHYLLDTYEVTVGRFRKFVEAYDGSVPSGGAGASPQVPESGWQAIWNAQLPATRGLLNAVLHCTPGLETWTDAPGSHETKPINCVTWYEAFAFCLWDGGRLPTEAEWERAAAGGQDNRLYPWGQNAPNATQASFGCGPCSQADILEAGSSHGTGRWGHEDLAGNVNEWVLDWYKWDWYTLLNGACTDCSCLHAPIEAFRSARGGAYDSYPDRLRSAARGRGTPEARSPDIGLRCAR